MAARPRPRLGQHFLHDHRILARIVRAARIEPGERVVEVGPGRGALTEHLLQAGADLVAVELDPSLAEHLRERFGEKPNFRIVEGDFLKAELAELAGHEEKIAVVGNLPYYVTSPIVRRILDSGHLVSRAVFLVQKETGERIAASKGTRDYGFLTALCRLRAEPELLFQVKPGAFRPPPRVDSTVIRLTMRNQPPPPQLVTFLAAAFSMPRKTLLNNLSPHYGRRRVAELAESGLRAQQLEVEDLVDLWRRLTCA